MVGPVTVHWRTLVDECRDLSLTAGASGEVSPTSENARAVQEDCHRLVLHPGSAVVYHLKEPICRWRIYSFAPDGANLTIGISPDGTAYQSAAADRRAFPSSESVYEYLTPILFSGELRGGDATFLRIANHPSRTNDSGRPEAIELSRVEIEYGHTDTHQAVSREHPAAKAVQLNSSIFVDGVHPTDDTLRAIDAAAAHVASGSSMLSSRFWSI